VSVDTTTNTALHNILRCIQSGDITRHQSPTGGWDLTVNDQPVTDPEIQLGVSVFDAQGCVHCCSSSDPPTTGHGRRTKPTKS
jgi:hypothetical protein